WRNVKPMNFPLAIRQLPFIRSIGRHHIKMIPSVMLGGCNDLLSVRHPPCCYKPAFNPGIVMVLKNQNRFTAIGVCPKQFAIFSIGGKTLDKNILAIGRNGYIAVVVLEIIRK